jgi:Na+-transporting NADH:ubiquinone oxidoreductase subunit NqrC
MKVNKDSHTFTILFTFFCTIVLVFPLTLVYVGTKPIADKYWLDQHVVKTLASMGLLDDSNPKNIDIAKAREDYTKLEKYTVGTLSKDSAGRDIVLYPKSYDYAGIAADSSKLVLLPVKDDIISKALQDNSYTGNYPVFFYVTEVNGQKRFGGDFTGPGLWGNVALAVGSNADGSQLSGLRVLFNQETPGLGGRIAETWFTGQFKDKKPGSGMVFNKAGSSVDNGFDAIAGATISSTAVKDTVNNKALILLKALIAQKGGTL